jgi:hypothetical protein
MTISVFTDGQLCFCLLPNKINKVKDDYVWGTGNDCESPRYWYYYSNCLAGVRKVRILDRLEVPQSISKLGSSHI